MGQPAFRDMVFTTWDIALVLVLCGVHLPSAQMISQDTIGFPGETINPMVCLSLGVMSVTVNCSFTRGSYPLLLGHGKLCRNYKYYHATASGSHACCCQSLSLVVLYGTVSQQLEGTTLTTLALGPGVGNLWPAVVKLQIPFSQPQIDSQRKMHHGICSFTNASGPEVPHPCSRQTQTFRKSVYGERGHS